MIFVMSGARFCFWRAVLQWCDAPELAGDRLIHNNYVHIYDGSRVARLAMPV